MYVSVGCVMIMMVVYKSRGYWLEFALNFIRRNWIIKRTISVGIIVRPIVSSSAVTHTDPTQNPQLWLPLPVVHVISIQILPLPCLYISNTCLKNVESKQYIYLKKLREIPSPFFFNLDRIYRVRPSTSISFHLMLACWQNIIIIIIRGVGRQLMKAYYQHTKIEKILSLFLLTTHT